jgi:RimJ/RimL family protein N-acetyltransferase
MTTEVATCPPTVMSSPQPALWGGTIFLRPWSPTDAPQVLEAFSDPMIRKWHGPAMTCVAEASEWIDRWAKRWEAKDGAAWAITKPSDPGRVMGHVALRPLDIQAGFAECSYWVLPEFRGNGIAPKATHAMQKWAFQNFRLNRIEIAHWTGNWRSCRVARKAGFAQEGYKRSLHRYSNLAHDMCLHAAFTPAKAEAKARPRDRAFITLLTHNQLWQSALVFSLGVALLSLKNSATAFLTPALLAVAIMARWWIVHLPMMQFWRHYTPTHLSRIRSSRSLRRDMSECDLDHRKGPNG